MRSYAETSGAITEYEKTGIVPESYSLYEKDYYNKLFGQSMREFKHLLLDCLKASGARVVLGSWLERYLLWYLVGTMLFRHSSQSEYMVLQRCMTKGFIEEDCLHIGQLDLR